MGYEGIMQNRCLKQSTVAIIMKDGHLVGAGYNWIKTPPTKCPREGMKSGEGYELCKSICNQSGHAEVNACRIAGDNARGGTLYLIGHTYCCDNCKKVMDEYGIEKIIICG